MASRAGNPNDAGRFGWLRRITSPSGNTRKSLARSKSTKQSKIEKEAQGSEQSDITDSGLENDTERRAITSTSQGSSSQRPNATDAVETPSAMFYAFSAGKQTIEVLQKFANSLPVPCANEALQVALLMMTTYEEVTELEEQIKNLNNRIAGLMLVMVDGLSGKPVDSISPETIRDIEKLGSDLQAIQKTLAKIRSQNRWLLVFFKDANREAVDACIERLNDALQSFSLMRHIRDGNALVEIQARLKSMDKTIVTIADQMNHIYVWMFENGPPQVVQPILVLEEMPVLGQLYGRDEVIKRIAQILVTKPRPRVGILGAGGTGKTSVAVAVMESELVGEKYQASHRFWVPCVGVTSLYTFLQVLSKSLGVDQSVGGPLKGIFDFLKSTQEPRLILLDNLETATSLPDVVTDGCQLSTERIIKQLAGIPHVSILVTIRSNTLPSDSIAWDLIHLEGVAREDARSIYTNICPSAADHPSLDDLLDALGNLPYAIMLMAMQAVNSFVEPDELLEGWRSLGTNSFSDDLKSKISRSIELSLERKEILGNQNTQLLLAILAQLPSGTSQKHLKWWAKAVGHIPSAIAPLNNTALITQRRDGGSSPSFFVLPVVQTYLHEQPLYNSPKIRKLVLEACTKFIVDHYPWPGEPNYKENMAALQFEKKNIQSILLGTTTEALLQAGSLNNIYNLFTVVLGFQACLAPRPSQELMSHALGILIATSSTLEKDEVLDFTAQFHYKMGAKSCSLDEYDKACELLESARSEFRQLGTSDGLKMAGEAALDLADVWKLSGKPGDEIERLLKEAQEDLKAHPKRFAYALSRLGSLYVQRSKIPEAMESLCRAKEALEEFGDSEDMVLTLISIAKCHAKQRENDKWLEVAQKAVQMSKSVGVVDGIYTTLGCLARYYIEIGSYDEALPILKEAWVLLEESGPSLANAIFLELTGYTYAMKGDMVGAKIAYEAATKQLGGLPATTHKAERLEACNQNLGEIAKKEGQEKTFARPVMYT
ncbi:hypothetical protein FRC17_005665 [Serendipita sp. 399]|nr:hypothetical protein FRC17_005665 [Serendipita sp. 399]